MGESAMACALTGASEVGSSPLYDRTDGNVPPYGCRPMRTRRAPVPTCPCHGAGARASDRRCGAPDQATWSSPMFVSDRIVFLELQKTGCTHIRNLLKEIVGGRLVMRHNQAPAELF